MKHTLFVDESGTFNRERERWIVAGVLVPGGPDVAERVIKAALAKPLMAHHERIAGPGALHLTNYRSSPRRAQGVAAAVLEALNGVQGARVGAVRNRYRKAVGGRSGPVGTHERSYRLMLLDLLSLLEASLPPDHPVTELHLVVATRTAKGAPMTRRDEIGEDVFAQIVDAVEAGLAARGLLEAASERRLHHHRANGWWGLGAADVVANVAFHEPDRDGGDRALVERFAPTLGFRVFDALGGYEVRRARVAERDGDLPLALARWAAWHPRNGSDRTEREEAVVRLADRLFALRDPYAPRVNLEATIERLRLSETSPEALGKSLRAVEEALARLGNPDEPVPQSLLRLLYRIRSFSRDAAHRRADFDEARRLAKLQAAHRTSVAADPEGFPLVLDDDVRAINALTQTLDLPEALEAARDYYALVERFAAVWGLFEHEGGDAAFLQSRTHLRATQTLARHMAFAAPLASPSGSDADRASDLLERLPPPSAPDDRSRLRNDRVLAAMRRGDPRAALAIATDDLHAKPTPYDLYYACRAASEALLHAPEEQRAQAEAVLDACSRHEEEFRSPHNPLQLAWRERALLLHLLGRAREAKEAIDRAAALTGNLPGDAPIKRWLALVVAVYRDAISGAPRPPSTHARAKPAESGHVDLVRRADAAATAPGGSPLVAVRQLTPY